MPELPWKTASEAPPPPDTEIVVMASRLTLTSVRAVPAFVRAALAIRRQVLASPGAVGVALIAEPIRKTFWTLSAWQDNDVLHRFVGRQPHEAVMKRFSGRMRTSVFVFWTTSAAELPIAWTEAKRLLKTEQATKERLAADERAAEEQPS